MLYYCFFFGFGISSSVVRLTVERNSATQPRHLEVNKYLWISIKFYIYREIPPSPFFLCKVCLVNGVGCCQKCIQKFLFVLFHCNRIIFRNRTIQYLSGVFGQRPRKPYSSNYISSTLKLFKSSRNLRM